MTTSCSVPSPVSRIAVAYARYSSSGQRDVSIDQQLRDIRAYAQREGYIILREYADHAKSGFKDAKKRSAFQRMMSDAEKKDFSTVIAWKVDRFGRNREESAVYKGRLRRLGVSLAYVMEPIPEGAAGALMEGMLEATAEWYSRNLSENVTRGMYDNAKNALCNGTYPYGYMRGPDGHYAIDPARAAIVREMFDMYRQGYNVSAIAKEMNARGYTSAGGYPWSTPTVHRLLRNERYTGVYLFGSVRIEDGMPAIVSKSAFQEVQQLMKLTHRRVHQSEPGTEYILTGKLYCGICGCTLIGDSGTGKSGRRHYYYSCLSKKNRHLCPKKSIRKDLAESLIIDYLLDHVLTDPVMESMADIVHREYLKLKEDSPIPIIKKTLDDVNRQIHNINSAIANGVYSSSTISTLKELESRAESLAHELQVQQALESDYSDRDRVLYWLHHMKSLDRENPKNRLTLIHTFINAAYVFDDHIRLFVNTKEGAERISFDALPSLSAPDGGSSFGSLVHVPHTNTSVFEFVVPLPVVNKLT